MPGQVLQFQDGWPHKGRDFALEYNILTNSTVNHFLWRARSCAGAKFIPCYYGTRRTAFISTHTPNLTLFIGALTILDSSQQTTVFVCGPRVSNYDCVLPWDVPIKTLFVLRYAPSAAAIACGNLCTNINRAQVMKRLSLHSHPLLHDFNLIA
jgi:hypothetical protein